MEVFSSQKHSVEHSFWRKKGQVQCISIKTLSLLEVFWEKIMVVPGFLGLVNIRLCAAVYCNKPSRFLQSVIIILYLTNILLMSVGDNIDRRPVNEEVLEATHKTITERCGPNFGWKFQVGVHVINTTHVQTSHEVEPIRLSF